MRLLSETINQKVHECMERDKIYLDASISLVRLGAIIGVNTTYLSNAINRCTGRNFRCLINDYRIAHAIKIIESGQYVGSIGGLMLRCGFTSPSVFHLAFKQRTGLSPLQYIQATARNGGSTAAVGQHDNKRQEHNVNSLTSVVSAQV